MVGVSYDMKVDDHTMKWLKNGGRDILINTSIEVSMRLMNRRVLNGFDLSIFYEGEKYMDEDELDEEDRGIGLDVVSKGTIMCFVDWYGNEGASVIFHILSEICKENGVQDIMEGSMKMGLVSLGIGNRILGEVFEDVKSTEPFLIANNGKDVNLRKYLEESEIPK